MRTFYFDTGVQPHTVQNPKFAYDYHKQSGHVIRGGTLQIPFDCDAPENARLLFLCSNKDLPEGKNALVCKVHNTTMASDYAYFAL